MPHRSPAQLRSLISSFQTEQYNYYNNHLTPRACIPTPFMISSACSWKPEADAATSDQFFLTPAVPQPARIMLLCLVTISAQHSTRHGTAEFCLLDTDAICCPPAALLELMLRQPSLCLAPVLMLHHIILQVSSSVTFTAGTTRCFWFW